MMQIIMNALGIMETKAGIEGLELTEWYSMKEHH